MRAVIQRVSQAQVIIDNAVHAEIAKGLCILIGIEAEDTGQDIEWLVKKLIALRIFNDTDDKMNNSISDVRGSFLVISQFTLYASTKKGNRPSFIKAAKPETAIPLYTTFLDQLKRESGLTVMSGVFGAEMQIALTNDGPVTILIDTKHRE